MTGLKIRNRRYSYDLTSLDPNPVYFSRLDIYPFFLGTGSVSVKINRIRTPQPEKKRINMIG